MTEPNPATDDAIVLECRLDHPPEQVWRALTEPQLLSRWLLATDAPPQAGARLHFAPDGPDAPEGAVEAEVLALEPPRLMRLAWRGAQDRRDARGDRLDSVVSFELQRVEGGTWLRVVHSGLAVRAKAAADVVPLRRRIATPPTEARLAA